jgi:N-acetylglucosaminyldiphosphoundecaprenol N-acetyl-beta-D-mannosaminyltransferase
MISAQLADSTITPPSVMVLGSRVHLVTLDQTIEQIERWIQERDGTCHRVVVTGFHGLHEAHKSASLQAILNSADLWVPDGIAPVLIARLRKLKIAGRVPGTEIMHAFFERANGQAYRSFFYGETEETLVLLRRKLTDTWPGHQIVGMLSPPFRPATPHEDREAIDRINDARPDVLWVALGAPKQDLWIHERLSQLNVPVAIGVGAAFRFVAGIVPRCPDWVGRAGLEWAYRFAKEPQKLWKRDLIDGPQFLFRVGLQLLSLRKYR